MCRALGAELVIAVDLSWGKLGPYRNRNMGRELTPPPEEPSWIGRLTNSWLGSAQKADEPRIPSIFEVFNTALDIVEQRVARSRLAGEPADVLITPLLPNFGTMEYHRAAEAIAEGRAAVARMMPLIEQVLL
jgi:NTE family protein